jgi:hypothetical protein
VPPSPRGGAGPDRGEQIHALEDEEEDVVRERAEPIVVVIVECCSFAVIVVGVHRGRGRLRLHVPTAGRIAIEIAPGVAADSVCAWRRHMRFS